MLSRNKPEVLKYVEMGFQCLTTPFLQLLQFQADGC
jgi:hypothetical protein